VVLVLWLFLGCFEGGGIVCWCCVLVIFGCVGVFRCLDVGLGILGVGFFFRVWCVLWVCFVFFYFLILGAVVFGFCVVFCVFLWDCGFVFVFFSVGCLVFFFLRFVVGFDYFRFFVGVS